ncbi:MAG: hypothetical protein EPO20_00975 [Betaproteobacteria bacterium]|nr:MAG: hypothetical protein EPO20_00975 [Betaproteobacteria bacterium]
MAFMRRCAALLTIFAVSLMLLWPACDGADADHAQVLQGGSHWSSLAAVASASKGPSVTLAPFIAALSVAALAFLVQGTTPSAAPLPTRTFYARSARILR